jgi:predicted  nucleic acid-binding Zn-ribbon protein
VDSQERSALLSDGDVAPDPVTTPIERQHVGAEAPAPPQKSSGEPTQRLLTALGRFQREVLKVREGVAAVGWSDECMNQLITAVEIADENDWPDVVETLTETARILKSYEDAGQPSECVGFLEDSYEILCLMVGDILVGTVRSAAMKKWRERHDRAVEDLAAAGITLVVDAQEAPSPIEDDEPADDIDSLPQVIPFAPAAAALEKPQGDDAEEDGVEEIEATDDEPETADDEVTFVPGSSDEEEEAAAADATAEVSQVLDALCDAFTRWENSEPGDENGVHDKVDGAIASLISHAEEAGNLGALPTCETLKRLCNWRQAHSTKPDDKFFELAFAFCDAYAQTHGETAASETVEWMTECEAYMLNWSEDGDDSGAHAKEEEEETVDVADIDEEEDSVTSDEVPAAEDSPAEIVEDATVSEDLSEETAVESPLIDLVDELAPIDSSEEASEPEEASPAAVAAEDSPLLQMLATAQQAASQGNAGDAKILALQVAAHIATEEADAAGTCLMDAEERLRAGTQAIEDARQTVSDAEQSVENSEAQVRDGESDLAQHREHIETIQSAISGVEETLADLDAQIVELQATREAEAANLAERQGEMETARQDEATKDVELSQRKDAEDAARHQLEDARQAVKAQQHRRMEIEADRDGARQSLNDQQSSLQELKQTIDLFGGGDKNDESDDELLF